MATNKHALLRPRAFAAGFAACAALGATAPAALADVTIYPKSDPGEISIAGTGQPEHLSFLYDPQHPNDVVISATTKLESLICEKTVFQQKDVMRCDDVERVDIDLSTNDDSLGVVGPVKYDIKWTGAPGTDKVDLSKSAGSNWIDAGPDTGADHYRLSATTMLDYAGRNASVLIDHTQLGNDGAAGGDETDEIVGAHGSSYQLTKFDDVFVGAQSPIADKVNGADGKDYLVGGGGADVLKGWNGNDTLEGTGTLEGGPDDDALLLAGDDTAPRLLVGGAGVDRLLAGGDQSGGMVVRLDGLANDGYTGGDLTANVGKDIENVDTTGNNISVPDTIIGSDADNVIVTGLGPDQVNPGKGADTVDTGDGADKVDSIDGVADSIDCGPAFFDELSADKIDARKGCDNMIKDIETLPPVEQPPVDQPPADLPPADQQPAGNPPVVHPPVVNPPQTQPVAKLTIKAKLAKQKLRTLRRTKRLPMRVNASQAVRLGIKVTARRGGKTVRLGHRSPQIAANRWTTVKVKLSKQQLRKVRKGKRIQVAFKAAAGDSRASLTRKIRLR
jgi:hypothetical protein